MILVLSTLVLGCKDSAKLVPVSGKVVLKGGSPLPKFQMGNISLIPVNPSGSPTGPRPASGEIDNSDSTFSLSSVSQSSKTRRPNPGVVPGEYKVVLTIFDRYPPGPKSKGGIVDRKYMLPETTDYTVKIDKAAQDLVIEVDPYKKGK